MNEYPIGSMVNVSASDLSWLSGVWYGQVGDDGIEEHWSGPAAGTLMGMFRSFGQRRTALVVLPD